LLFDFNAIPGGNEMLWLWW